MDLGRVYGLNACQMFAKLRKEKIVRAFFSKKVAPQFSDTMKFLASKKKVYRLVENDELEKVSQSQHNEGVCFMVEKKEPQSLKTWLTGKTNNRLVVLENIGNPHNLGAIMRICAHFGFDSLAMSDVKVAQSGAASRVAEGGAEFIEFLKYDNFRSLAQELKKNNFEIITTSSHDSQGRDAKKLFGYKFPKKFALVFGEEGPGLAKETMDQGNVCIKIPGTDRVESLNVSTAISVILAEVYRQNHL